MNSHQAVEWVWRFVVAGLTVALPVLIFMLNDLKESIDTLSVNVQANAIALASIQAADFDAEDGLAIWKQLGEIEATHAEFLSRMTSMKDRIGRLETVHGRPPVQQ